MKKYAIILLLVSVVWILVINSDKGKSQTTRMAKTEPIKIGLLVELTGGNAAYGYSHERVMKAAVQKVNKEGGILGRPIELYIEDTETKPSVGALKFRKLVETYSVDFIFNSNFSGVAVACAPIAKELRMPYFPCVGAVELSAEKGNRYVFNSATNAKQGSKAAAKFAFENIGKKWVVVVMNFAWGWSIEQEFTRYMTENGGTVLNSIKVPLGTGDWMPYLQGKIPQDAEAVFFANFGSDFLSFIRDLYAIRPDIKKMGADYALSAQDPKKLGAPAEGLYCLTSYPTRLDGLNTKYNKTYRELIGVDPEGKEVATGKYFVLSFDWAVWEPFFALKAALEKSGWQGKEDTPKVIKTLEGMQFKESVEFPQGDVQIRAQDHLAVARLYVEHLSKGELKVVARIPASDAVYPPLADYTKEPF